MNHYPFTQVRILSTITHLLYDDGFDVLLDLHEHVCPGPVLVVVLQSGDCEPPVLNVLQTHILTLGVGRGCILLWGK